MRVCGRVNVCLAVCVCVRAWLCECHQGGTYSPAHAVRPSLRIFDTKLCQEVWGVFSKGNAAAAAATTGAAPAAAAAAAAEPAPAAAPAVVVAATAHSVPKATARTVSLVAELQNKQGAGPGEALFILPGNQCDVVTN